MKDELLFCPLGGSGEIGMNMNLFGYGQPSDHKWIMVDIGVTFADDTIPGVDLIYPDPGFIVERKDNLLGIVLTHAHEDHIGAIAHLWPKLKCKIFATPFTAVRSGFFWGYAGLIDNIINLIKKETGKSFKVIITGGFSNLFKNSIKTKASHNQDITIKGLIKISKLIK